MFVKKSIPRESLKIPDYPKPIFWGWGETYTKLFLHETLTRNLFSTKTMFSKPTNLVRLH